MKLRKSIILFVLVALLSISLLSGCAGQRETDTNNQPTVQPTTDSEPEKNNDEKNNEEKNNEGNDEPITLTYWYPMWSNEAELMQNIGENRVYQKLEELTGVKVEFISPPVADNLQAFMTLIASKDLPDIIMHDYYVDYPGGPDKAIADGVYLRLNELIEDYAPNYLKLITEDETLYKQTRTDSGNIWCFSMIDTYAQPAYLGPAYRKDWLEDLNIEVPTTMDEVHDMLVAFKEKKGATAPLLMPSTGVYSSYMLLSAYGVSNSFFNDGGQLKFGPTEPGYKQYLETMASWYKEGLIDPEFPTKTDTSNDISTGKAGMWEDGFWSPPTRKAQAEDPNFDMTYGPYITLEKGQKVNIDRQNYRSQQNNTAVTTSCKYPEKAVEWLDFKYSEEGFLLCNYGIEGETYVMKDGKPEYTEFFTENKNPRGLAYMAAQYFYLLGKGPYLRQWDRELFAQPEYSMDWMNTLENSSTSEGCIPPFISMTPEEGEEYNVIMGDINTFVTEKTVAIITGAEPVSNWDEYVNTIKNMGLETALKIYNDAFQRYLAR